MLKALLSRAIRRTETASAREPARSGTVDDADIDRFARIADRWWDPDGPHGPLHRFVPVRMVVIRDALSALVPESRGRRALDGLEVLDLGCGGGLLSEPMTRLGAKVTGVDADGAGIAAATAHAGDMGLDITYRAGSAEELVAEGMAFDAVVASEVIEHVADRAAFVSALSDLVRPGGVLVITTINRTARSRAQAIIAAEYILRWVPRGTHDWNQFPKPEELSALLERGNFAVEPPLGMVFDPLDGSFALSADVRVNYALVARRL